MSRIIPSAVLRRRDLSDGKDRKSRYDGFISYSHGADLAFAPSLQRGLRKLAKPWYRRNALRVFLDKTSLAASTNLQADLDGPIGQSEFFILLASTQAASPDSWVRKEVDFWIKTKGSSKLLIAKTDGEISWNAVTNDFDWEKTTALPRALVGIFKAEPNYIDFSQWQSEVRIDEDPNFREAIARLAAPIHGKSMEDLFGEDLDQHRRTQRIVRAAVSVLCALFLVASASAVVAVKQRNIAVEAERQAVDERNRALVALFQGLHLNIGNNQNAGSLCLEAGPRCVRGREIAGVQDLDGTSISLGLLDKNTWIGAVSKNSVSENTADEPAANDFVVASRLGEGRVIGYGHDGLIRDVAERNCAQISQCQEITDREKADNLRFTENALGWAMMHSKPNDCSSSQVTVAIYPGYEALSNTTEISMLAQRKGWVYKTIDVNNDIEGQLRCLNALIWGNPWTISDTKLATIVDYVSDGGGLLLGGLGWSWILYNPGELPIEAYPANRLATSFGFSFTSDSFEVGVDLRLQPPKN